MPAARSIRVAALGSAVAAAILAGAAGDRTLAEGFDRHQPEPTYDGASPYDGSAWTVDTDSVRIRLEPLDDAGRLAFLRARTGATGDPFAAVPGSEGGFVTFRIALENRSRGLLVFESQACRMASRAEDARSPLDLPTIESAYRMIDRELPEVFQTIRPLIFDGTLFLEAGKSAEGLLAYRPIPGKPKRFWIVVPVTTTDGARTELKAVYRKRKR